MKSRARAFVWGTGLCTGLTTEQEFFALWVSPQNLVCGSHKQSSTNACAEVLNQCEFNKNLMWNKECLCNRNLIGTVSMTLDQLDNMVCVSTCQGKMRVIRNGDQNIPLCREKPLFEIKVQTFFV